MPPEEFNLTTRVGKDHSVVLSFPALAEGTEVSVKGEIAPLKSKRQRRKPGSASGLIVIRPGFDDPIPGFEEYR